MKKVLIIAAIVLLFKSVHAQTVTNAEAPAVTNSTTTVSTNTFFDDLTKVFADEVSFFGSNTTFTADIGAIYSDKQLGAIVNFHTPLPIGTNQQVSIGVGLVYLDSQLYSGTININFGATYNVPVIGNVRAWAEAGPMFNFKSQQAGVWSAAGFTKGWDLFSGHWLYVSAFTGDISDRSGVVYGGAFSMTF